MTHPPVAAESHPSRVERRLAFAYGRTLVWARLLLIGESAGLVAFLLVLFGNVPLPYVAILAGVHGVAFVVYGVSPLFTQHWLTRSRIVLRQGWYFRASIPFSAIESIAPADPEPRRVPLGIHRRLGRSALYVTAGLTGLVEIRLSEPRRFFQAFGLAATSLVFDVTDRAAFLEAFEARRRLLAPVQAERADP
ncbi:MAG TPA: hypothetical protein VJ326_08850 [Thermoplasmata archaeon]|nr:hypothetical protein [Thermoplasmata archaeon]